MAATRQRKLLTEDHEEDKNQNIRYKSKSNTKFAPRSKGATKKLQRFFYILIAFTFVSIFAYYVLDETLGIQSRASHLIHKLLSSIGMAKFVYAVIIDAGSTGSRVLAFSFYQPVFGNNLKLDHELFVQVKPGLSSYADNPKKGAESLQTLLDQAMEVIPSSEWGNTPLVMKATAGLRLLPGHQAEALLDEVRFLFKLSPFVTGPSSVSIMDGVDEGLFSWFTVNFLLDYLHRDVSKTVAALDLGGGSTQITFAPSKVSTLNEADNKFLHQMAAFHRNLTVYTHSYLGLGLMAARKEILLSGNKPESRTLISECVNPIIDVPWSYGGVEYTVKGIEARAKNKNPKAGFDKCMHIVKSYVGHHVDKPAELAEKEINAFSYYFDRATEYGLIDPFEGGKITVKDLVQAAKSTCKEANADQPFMCVDLIFISVLLQDGFGLNENTTLNLYKKIDGHEISWALGAAFNVLQNGL